MTFTPEEIAAMAKEARIGEMGLNIDGSIHLHALFARFAALVAEKAAADEREACELVCDAISQDKWALYKGRPPYTGREEGRASSYVYGQNDGAYLCEAAIRARGQKE